jgi:hypothetical protein
VEYYGAIDVSLELSSVCVVDGSGKIVREAKVASEPEALVGFFRDLNLVLTRIGLEAGPLSQWLHAGLTEAGLAAILIETRHVKAALKAMTVKTDRNARLAPALLARAQTPPINARPTPLRRACSAVNRARASVRGQRVAATSCDQTNRASQSSVARSPQGLLAADTHVCGFTRSASLRRDLVIEELCALRYSSSRPSTGFSRQLGSSGSRCHQSTCDAAPPPACGPPPPSPASSHAAWQFARPKPSVPRSA